jgi:hypothetical protein
MYRPWFRALLTVGLLVVACGPASGRPSAPTGAVARTVNAQPDLRPPYDFAGVLDALNRRMPIASVPTAKEATGAGISREAFLDGLRALVEASYPGEGARAVSAHLVMVDVDDPHIDVDHRLAYVVETTGHATGNCFTMFDASTAVQFLASCFHSERTRP